MNKTLNFLQRYSGSVLRWGMAAVVLWFSIQQFMHADQWTAYIPDSIISLSHVSALTIVYLNAVFEMVFGTLLMLGIWTRLAALLLALHLFDIAWTVGYGQIGARDVGLAVATLAVFMQGADPLATGYQVPAQPLPSPDRFVPPTQTVQPSARPVRMISG